MFASRFLFGTVKEAQITLFFDSPTPHGRDACKITKKLDHAAPLTQQPEGAVAHGLGRDRLRNIRNQISNQDDAVCRA